MNNFFIWQKCAVNGEKLCSKSHPTIFGNVTLCCIGTLNESSKEEMAHAIERQSGK